MPGLIAFGRRWSVGSDDLFLPSLSLGIIQIICLIGCILSLVVDIHELETGIDGCGSYLLERMILALSILSTGLLFTFILMIISLRGSILDDRPRKSAQYLIYILLLTMMSWCGFCIIWIHHFYSTCTIEPTKEIVLGLVICSCFVFVSVMVTGWCVYDGAGRSWVKMKRYQASMKQYEQKNPAIYKRSGSRHGRNWRQRKVMRAYQDSWDHRCRFLFCCMHRTERTRDSFADLARLLSEFFRDLDVVPSDVVVALLLLRRLQRLEQCSIVKQKRNNTYEFLSGMAITSKTKFVGMNDANDLEIFGNVLHFMYYASAAYGWPWFLIPNGCKGLCRLSSNLKCCCGTSELDGIVLEDNCCYCNYAVLPTIFDIGSCDIVYATYHVEVGETPFFVVVDYNKEAIVVSIRGTLSLKDVITDLNAEGEILPVEPRKEDWIGHKGIVAAAVYMKSKLTDGGILQKAMDSAPSRGTCHYRLVLVGHSLGAGTAAILAVLLKDLYPNLECYAFSPPGGLLSMPVVEYTKGFVISVIVGKDLVPRIGLSQMEALRADLINAMKKSSKPKWQTLMSGMVCCCCLKPEFGIPQRLSSAPSISSEEFLRSQRSLKDLREVTLHPNESALSLTVHQPLYPPGRIMHIVRHHPKKDEIKYESLWRRVLKKEPVFQALWTENTDYGQVLISPGMIEDHMPHQVIRALHRVVTSHGPAKPQRQLPPIPSPVVLSREGLVNEIVTHVHPCNERILPSSNTRETEGCFTSSFGNSESSIGPCSTYLVMNPNRLIADADGDESIQSSQSSLHLTHHPLFSSLNLSWDFVSKIHEKYLEESSVHHSHDYTWAHVIPPPRLPFPYSSSSSHTEYNDRESEEKNEDVDADDEDEDDDDDDPGSTFKEVFGPIKYEEWMAPLASPETLSEISSLSSRASFLLSKDQSPLLHRLTNGKSSMNHSKELIESNILHTTKSSPQQQPKYNPLLHNGLDTSKTIHKKNNGADSTKRVSFNLKKKSKELIELGSFDPTYPIFSRQQEYGVAEPNYHYTYCGQSPIDSPDIIFTTPCQQHSHSNTFNFDLGDSTSQNSYSIHETQH